MPGASGEQRARAGILAARRAHTRGEWELITALGGATAQQLATAYHEIGLSYMVEAKTVPAIQLKVVEGFQKAAEQMAKYDPRAADTELGMATVLVQSAPPSPASLAVLDQVYKSLLALPLSPDQKALRNSRLEIGWGTGLQKLAAVERAIAVWQGVGKNTGYPAEQREEAWLKASDALQAQKKPDQALAALQAATPLRADNWVYSAKLAEKKLDLLEGQKRYAEALKVVEVLAKHPNIPAAQKETLLLSQAKFLYRLSKNKEAAALLAPLWQNPPRAGLSIHDVAVTKAQAAIDRKDLAQARQEVEAGLARLRELKLATQQLDYVSARLFVGEKKYDEALAAYARCCTTTIGIAPSETVVREVRAMFSQTIQEKKLAEAQAIFQGLAKWQVDPMVPALMEAQWASAAGDTARARTAVTRCRQELKRFYGPNKEAFEKEIAAVEASLGH